MRTLRAARLALREALSKPTLQRRPEPSPDMSDRESVQAFHAQGSDDGALLGVYHFNARAAHALAPAGGTVVDLGCGSGQCLRYLARRRPDLRLLGIDLSKEMVAAGDAMLREHSLADRVELRVGDMTAFSSQLPARVDLVTSIFSLHHLPTERDLYACLREIGRVRSQFGAAFWIFDHARPRRRETAEGFPGVFTPDASPAFNADSTNSLVASWSFDELRAAVAEAIAGTHQARLARILRLYQVHWAEAASHGPIDLRLWHEPAAAAKSTLRDAKGLAGLFESLPG